MSGNVSLQFEPDSISCPDRHRCGAAQLSIVLPRKQDRSTSELCPVTSRSTIGLLVPPLSLFSNHPSSTCGHYCNKGLCCRAPSWQRDRWIVWGIDRSASFAILLLGHFRRIAMRQICLRPFTHRCTVCQQISRSNADKLKALRTSSCSLASTEHALPKLQCERVFWNSPVTALYSNKSRRNRKRLLNKGIGRSLDRFEVISTCPTLFVACV